MKLAPIYRDGKRVILCSTGKKSQPLIRLEESKPLVQSVHLELPDLAIHGIKGFQLDMSVHALSDLGPTRVRNSA